MQLNLKLYKAFTEAYKTAPEEYKRAMAEYEKTYYVHVKNILAERIKTFNITDSYLKELETERVRFKKQSNQSNLLPQLQ